MRKELKSIKLSHQIEIPERTDLWTVRFFNTVFISFHLHSRWIYLTLSLCKNKIIFFQLNIKLNVTVTWALAKLPTKQTTPRIAKLFILILFDFSVSKSLYL